MPRSYPPSVFVSSTCYDLSQIRLDLKRFIEGLGYDPVISESSAFPVNPQASTVENVVGAVRDRADVMVLIVGARYGTTTGPENRSITNLEYLEAKAKGIPTYVFVSKRIIHQLPIWRENPDADYSNVVDTPKLFVFADHLRKETGAWVFEFDEGEDIINTLRQQWSFLFSDALEIRNKVHGSALGPDIMSLAAEPLSIVLKKPRAWEHRLFAAVVRSELQKLDHMRLDLKYGVRFGNVVDLKEPRAMLDWIQAQLERSKRLIDSAVSLTNSALTEALGATGVAGDPGLLAYVGRRVAYVVKEMLEWRLDFLTASVDPEFERLVELIGGMMNSTLGKIESLADLLDSEIDKALAAEAKGEHYVANVQLVFDTPMTAELQAELDNANSIVQRKVMERLR